jgi:[ribosomal protein S5]-alanine N-acetyltransferase
MAVTGGCCTCVGAAAEPERIAGMRTLSSSPFSLEPQTVAHAHEMFSVLSDLALYEFENGPPPSEEWLVERFARLEHRVSPDGRQLRLNWVIRLPSRELAGYVQATVHESGAALVAYELASKYWRRGIGSGAVSAMLQELRVTYNAELFVAVLKRANHRSMALLRHLRFQPASAQQAIEFGAEPDEAVMVKSTALSGSNS